MLDGKITKDIAYNIIALDKFFAGDNQKTGIGLQMRDAEWIFGQYKKGEHYGNNHII
jgi:hypothetical protein